MTRKKACFLFCLIWLTAAYALAAEQQVMSVQVKEGQVRAGPSFLGKIVARLVYGERVAVLGEKGAWFLISLPRNAGQGWMHNSALTRKKIILKAGAANVSQSASSDEIALAGKGFNQQVESEFKAKNPNIDFTWIDRMEKIKITQKEMRQFLEAGRVLPEGGSHD
jgi:uncharacterized protein YgiM (DUF1202 family)